MNGPILYENALGTQESVKSWRMEGPRRRYAHERSFHVCNLRKSYGFYLVASGADPIPSVKDVAGFYRLTVVKQGPIVSFRIRGPEACHPELEVLRWRDDGVTYGPILAGGRIGFRQMAPLIAEYGNLTVRSIDATDRIEDASPDS